MNKIIFFFYLACFSVFASDVTININGSVLSQSCNVSSDNLITNIYFNDLSSSDFTSVGSVSETQPMSIHLENCTGNINNMSYQFSGDSDKTDSTLLKISGKPNSVKDEIATGIAIEILDKNKKKISLNTKQFLNDVVNTSNYDLSFNLRYKSTDSKVKSGDASSIMYLDIYYE
ncbi:fimbrial protein [Providencia stuartii]|uniref:fimbrial protein n=1 Tax=Providencia stuartii TaxID=588 RepID=UPI00111DABA4|nr:fimbrial protein [Providencia stuartii]